MTIDKTFKIKEKYFNAILKLEKPFELRHEKVEPNSIIKLECENGRYLIFKSGDCAQYSNGIFEFKNYFYKMDCDYLAKYYGDIYDYDFYLSYDWFDWFCNSYINEAPTHLIEIAEILEVK